MKIVFDLDDTLCVTDPNVSYFMRIPKRDMIKKLREYKKQGAYIIIATGRQMRTYEGNIGKINANTLPVIIDWLKKHDVPYDEIYVGKPWEGSDGFRVCDKTIRPREFRELTYMEIMRLLQRDK